MGFQLTLGLKLNSKVTLQNYISGPNQGIIEEIHSRLDCGSPFVLYLQGQAFSGKSHILQGVCHERVYQGLQAGYIDLKDGIDIDLLKSLDHLKMLAFDHYDCTHPDQVALFKTFLAEAWMQKKQVLIASQQSLPSTWIDLPLILSRILEDLSPQDLQKLVKMKADTQGLSLSEEICEFIVKKSEKNLENILSHINKIESACDLDKKKLSLRRAKVILEDLSVV